jgi:hypothetical protein
MGEQQLPLLKREPQGVAIFIDTDQLSARRPSYFLYSSAERSR